MLDGPYSVVFWATTPTTFDRPVASTRADRLRRYPSSAIAARTRVRVVAETCGCPLSTRETVWCETPARAATSDITGPRDGGGTLTSPPRSSCG
jgi:hypothetical protein